jgi:hypothetical protein
MMLLVGDFPPLPHSKEKFSFQKSSVRVNRAALCAHASAVMIAVSLSDSFFVYFPDQLLNRLCVPGEDSKGFELYHGFHLDY